MATAFTSIDHKRSSSFSSSDGNYEGMGARASSATSVPVQVTNMGILHFSGSIDSEETSPNAASSKGYSVAELDSCVNQLSDNLADTLARFRREEQLMRYNVQSLFSVNTSSSTGSAFFGGTDDEESSSFPRSEGLSATPLRRLSADGDDDATSSRSDEEYNFNMEGESPVPSWKDYEAAKKNQRLIQSRSMSRTPAQQVISTPSSPLMLRQQEGESPSIELDGHQSKHSPNHILPKHSSKGNKFAPEHCSMDTLKKMSDELLQAEDLAFMKRAPKPGELLQPSEIRIDIDKKSPYARYEQFCVLAAYSQSKNSWEFHYFPLKDYRS